jgi:predicted PolB exonuclease-like 3'-5' exonuclease
MFKSVPNDVFAFDLEWIPDTAAGRALLGLPSGTPELQVWEAMWKAAGATAENPRPFLKTIQSRIVSVAVVSRKLVGTGPATVRLTSLPKRPNVETERSEGSIIGTFLNAVGERKPQLIGFYSGNADLPILVQRAIVHGIQAAGFSKRPAKPWEGYDYFDSRNSEGHIDLSTISGGWKSTFSLNEIATLSGIPGKIGVSGGDVAQMWLDGRYEEIVAYNEFDSLTTYLVWLRAAHFAGFFTSEQYVAEQTLVVTLLKSEITAGRKHLQAFLDAWSFKVT